MLITVVTFFQTTTGKLSKKIRLLGSFLVNIGIVTTWFERGAAYVSRAYLETLSTKHRVFIYARGGEQYAQDDPKWNQSNVTWGKKIVPVNAMDIDWLDFENWVYQNKLDIVLFNEQRYWMVVLKSLELDVLIGAYVDYYTEETIPFFALYDFLLCNTQRHYSIFRDHPQAFYIPWGTDCDVFRPNPYRVHRQYPTFFHSAGMGGLNLRKGTDILVRAFQHVYGQAKLIIHSQVGLDSYGAIADLIRNDPRIEFIHETVGAPGLYHLGDVYVYPTKLEGIGLSIAEALASGLPVITTDEAPMNEFVVNNVTGVLVTVAERRQRFDGYYWPESYCSEEALVKAMQRYVDHPTLIQEQGQQARAHAIDHLDWYENSRDLPALISSLERTHSQSWMLKQKVARHERRNHRLSHIDQMFLNYEKGDFAAARRHYLQGILCEPRYWRNLGVWSIGGELILGKRRAEAMRRLFRSVQEIG